MFIAAEFTIAKPRNQPKCPLTEEWIKKMWYIFIPCNVTQPQKRKNAICNNKNGPRDDETKRERRETPYAITSMWNLKQGTNASVYRTETDSETQSTDLWLPRGREWDGGGVWDQQRQTMMIDWINNKILL